MFDAAREKTRLWLLILVGVVATLLGQTHAREIFAPSPPASGEIALTSPSSTGDFYDADRYDVPDSLLAAKGAPNIVYRGLTAADAEAMAAGRGLTAKAPGGTWTAGEHVANAGPGVGGAGRNSPWISTSRRLDVAQAYDSGHGVIAIDLNKVSSFQAEVWKTAPRVNGVQGLPFHRSFWAEEVTIHQEIPFEAILGPIK